MKCSLLILILFCSGQVFSAQKTISICTLEWPPYFGVNEKGNGWAWVVLEEAAALKGYQLKLNILPWARAVQEVKHGVCDALAGAYYTKERAEWALFSEPLGEAKVVLFKHQDLHIEFNHFEDLKPYQIGVGHGFVASPAFDAADYLNKLYLTHANQGLKMVFAKRLDLMVFGEKPGLKMLQKIEHEKGFKGISQVVKPLSHAIKVNTFHLAISKKIEAASALLKDINDGIRVLRKSGRYDEIIEMNLQHNN